MNKKFQKDQKCFMGSFMFHLGLTSCVRTSFLQTLSCFEVMLTKLSEIEAVLTEQSALSVWRKESSEFHSIQMLYAIFGRRKVLM